MASWSLQDLSADITPATLMSFLASLDNHQLLLRLWLQKLNVAGDRTGGRLERVHLSSSALGTQIELTGREFDLLAYLCRHAGKVITHRILLEELWGPGVQRPNQLLTGLRQSAPPKARRRHRQSHPHPTPSRLPAGPRRPTSRQRHSNLTYPRKREVGSGVSVGDVEYFVEFEYFGGGDDTDEGVAVEDG